MPRWNLTLTHDTLTENSYEESSPSIVDIGFISNFISSGQMRLGISHIEAT